MAKRPVAYEALGLACVTFGLGYFVVFASNNLQEVPPLDWGAPHVWGVFAAATLAYGGGMALLAVAWVLVLRGLGSSLPLRPATGVVFAAQLGKYLPGNVLHLVGRIALARELGCSVLAASASLVFEIVWLIGLGSVVTLVWLSSASAPPALTEVGVGSSSVLLAVPIAVCMWPPLIRRLAIATGERIPRLAPLKTAPLPGFRVLLSCMALFMCNFSLMGLNLYLLAGLFVEGPLPLGLQSFIGLGTGAWLIGFITPGAPGGLGVRESLLVLFLSPALGSGAAIGTTLSFRVVSLLADGLAFPIGSALLAGTGEPPTLDTAD